MQTAGLTGVLIDLQKLSERSVYEFITKRALQARKIAAFALRAAAFLVDRKRDYACAFVKLCAHGNRHFSVKAAEAIHALLP